MQSLKLGINNQMRPAKSVPVETKLEGRKTSNNPYPITLTWLCNLKAFPSVSFSLNQEYYVGARLQQIYLSTLFIQVEYR